MKTVHRAQYGNSDVLQIIDTEIPQINDHEILIKVHASTVNRTDCAILTGKPFVMRFFSGLFKPNPTTGTDFAGRVEAVGKKITSYKPGDKVIGFNDLGLTSHAQYLKISQQKFMNFMPDNISYAQAVGGLEGGHYAYNFINKLKVLSGEKVFINGSTGAIGSALLQFAKEKNMQITVVCDSHFDTMRALGADRIINFQEEDFTKDKEKYKYVWDAVGKSSFGECKKILEPGGIYISSELGAWSQNLILSLFPFLTGKNKIIFPFPHNIAATLNKLNQMMIEGKFKAMIDRTYSLEEIQSAYTYVASGQKKGSVVLILHEEKP